MSPALLHALAAAMEPSKSAAFARHLIDHAANMPGEVIDRFGISPGYSLGAGDAKEIDSGTKLRNSVLPWIGAGIVGGIGGWGAGHLTSMGLEGAGALHPAGEAAGAAAPSYQLSEGASESVRKWAPTVGALAGTQLAQSATLREQFMRGVRDSRAANANSGPWDGPGTAQVRVPWKH